MNIYSQNKLGINNSILIGGNYSIDELLDDLKNYFMLLDVRSIIRERGADHDIKEYYLGSGWSKSLEEINYIMNEVFNDCLNKDSLHTSNANESNKNKLHDNSKYISKIIKISFNHEMYLEMHLHNQKIARCDFARRNKLFIHDNKHEKENILFSGYEKTITTYAVIILMLRELFNNKIEDKLVMVKLTPQIVRQYQSMVCKIQVLLSIYKKH